MPFRFAAPLALILLLAVPLLILILRHSLAGLGPVRRGLSFAVRCGIVACLALALAELQWVDIGRDLAVLYLVDQSASIPLQGRREAVDYVNASVAAAGKADRAGVIAFGREAILEKMPAPVASAPGPLGPAEWYRPGAAGVNRERTDVAAAIRFALAAFPENTRKRIVLVSDGCENQGIAAEQTDAARSAGCPIDVMMIVREHEREVWVEKALAPARLRVGEPFELHVVLRSLQPCDAEIDLAVDGQPLQAGRKLELRQGKEVASFSFPEGLAAAGPHTFEAVIRSASDTLLENNTGTAFTWVEGKARKVLVVTTDAPQLSYLLDAMAKEDIEAATIGPEQFPGTVAGLREYDCLVLSNVPAHEFAAEQLGMIEGAVRDLGMGLVLIGGPDSFGAGGYRGTPVETCSPVDFDIRQKRVMPKGAIVLMLDAAEDPDANRWAIEMARSAANVLSFHDEIGIISMSQWYLPLREAGDKKAIYDAIDKLQVSDDDNFDIALNMSANVLEKSDAASRHVLIMTDGGHGAYAPSAALVKSLEELKVSVSVVVFRPHADSEQQVVTSLKQLAFENRGRFYYPRDANEIPRIFFKEAALVTRSLIFEDSNGFNPAVMEVTDPIRGFGEEGFPPLNGYVLTTPKPRAQVAAVRSYFDKKLEETVNDPIIAHWNYGLGKAVAFTSDATSRWASHWVSWPGYGKLWPQLVRWAFPASPSGKVAVRSAVDVRDGKARLSMDVLDLAGTPVNFLELRGSVLTPHADADGRFESHELLLRQAGPGRYECEFDAVDAGAYFASVQYAGADADGNDIAGLHTTGAAVACAPEYRELSANAPLLKLLADQTGGRMLTPETNVFERTMPAAAASQPAWPLLLLLAAIAFPADVAVRKVIIDWYRIYAAIAAQLARLRPRPQARTESVPALDRLLLRKKQTRRELAGDAALAAQAAPQPPPAQAAPAADAQRPEQPARVVPDAAQPEKPAPGPDVYTRRLIQAKKRVRKDGSAGGPSPGEPGA